jgi:hypothetical protein
MLNTIESGLGVGRRSWEWRFRSRNSGDYDNVYITKHGEFFELEHIRGCKRWRYNDLDEFKLLERLASISPQIVAILAKPNFGG